MSIERIQTDDKIREVWTHLEFFSTEDYVRNKLSAMHNDLEQNDLETKAFLISSCIKQAQEYYHAAVSVSMLTKPLLIYYGMYSLAKALIFLFNPMVSLGSISHHGLIKPRISESTEKLLDAETKLCRRGIFHQLSKHALTNQCVIKCDEMFDSTTATDVYRTFCSRFAELGEARVLTLGELLVALPELFEILSEAGIENNKLLKVDISLHKNISDNWARILAIYKTENDAITLEFLQNKFRAISSNKEQIREDSQCFVFQRSLYRDYNELIPSPLVQAVSGQHFLILSDKPISDICVHFAMMFLLSNIVRYKPPLWQKILKTTYKSVISKFLTVSESKFPNLILNELQQRPFIFVRA